MEEKEAVFINGNRTCYHPSQADAYTCTVGELRECLAEYDDDVKVFLRHDNGYTYGTIDCYEDVYAGTYNDDEVFVD